MEAGGKLFGVNQLLTEDSLNRKKKKKESLECFQYPGNFTAFVMEVLLDCFKSVMALMSFPRERCSPFPV